MPKFNFLGIGVVYCLIYIPNVLAIKVGYTGVSVGSRVKSVSAAVFGFVFPLGAFVLPFAWHVEQILHWLLRGLRWNFYNSEGHTETFVLPAHFIVLPIVWFGMYLDWIAVKWFYFHYIAM